MALIEFVNDNPPYLNAENLNHNFKEIFNLVYPIGSIYMSVNEINPGTLFGGTWERFAQGRVLVGVDEGDSVFNQVEKIAGSKSQELRALIGATDGDTGRIGYKDAASVPNQSYRYSVLGSNVEVDIPSERVNHSTAVLGILGELPSTIQPSISVYIWKRVA